MAYDSTQWIDRTDAVMGNQGVQGIVTIRVYRNATTRPTAPTGGTYVVETAVLTPPTGWVTLENVTAPTAGQDTWFVEDEVNPATQTGSITPDWSVVLEAGGTGPVGPAGADGATGADGMDGATGPAGATGATGSTGSAGAAGAAGQAGAAGAPGSVGPIGPVGPGAAGTPTSLSRFAAVTTANTTAQALSATYANILEFATTDIFANVGAFTVATVSNISTVTIPNSGLFKITCHIKAATTGSARAVLYLRANVLRSGVVVPNTATIMGGSYVRNFSAARTAILSGTTTLLLGAGDTVTFQMAEESNTGSTYTIGGADSVVEIVEIPSEVIGSAGPPGVAGPPGDQGLINVRQYQNAATIPTAGTGGTYVISTGVLTPSTGWVTIDDLTTPGAGIDTWFQEAEINPAIETTDSVTPDWSVVLEAGGSGPAGADGAMGPAGADGMDGAMGPAGADGADGTGGTFTAQDEGTTLGTTRRHD